MNLNTHIKRLQHFRRVNSCFLRKKPQAPLDVNYCSTKQAELSQEHTPKPKKVYTSAATKHAREIDQFFDENPDITPFKNFFPSKILYTRPYKTPEYFYLTCPNIARQVAKHVLKNLQGDNQVVAESNPGFGLITDALLRGGVPSVRLYELNHEFQEYLQEAFKEKHGKIELFKKDLFTLSRYAYFDNLDQGQRVSGLIKGIPKKSWTDDPVMTIVGTITKYTFLNYLVKSIVLQRELATYGRIDLFLLTYEKYWKLFTASTNSSGQLYRPSTILLQLFFEAELIDKYPREFFLPWEGFKKKQKKKRTAFVSDIDHLCLLRVTMKKDIPLHADQFVPFYCFMKSLYGLGKTSVIASCEKWVPGCGQNLILPKLAHDDYFENMDIFTKFKELSPIQITAVYRELAAHPDYPNSPFMDMVEQEWVKTETIDTDINDSHNKSPT